MTEDVHPDPAARLEFALWGATDEATREVQIHIQNERCPSCTAEVRTYQKVRHLMRAARDAAPDERLRRAVRTRMEEEALAAGPDLEWLVAQPVLVGVGTRSGVTTDRQVACEAGESHVDVLLHPQGPEGRFAVTGQVVLPDDDPAADLPVALFVDGREVATSRTDGYGQFEFDAHEGRRFGVRIGEGDGARHVEVWSADDPS